MLSRISAVRRLPQLTAVPRRFTSSLKEGSVAQSKGFSEKEKAHENEYARRHDAELLHKMKADMEKKKTELEQLEREYQAEAQKAGKV
ncbi:hypothetical protein B0H17DRAFT_1205459 [Mycena rosella]|uniref:Mitochondrial ATPase inhibitor n=1 Tax=Mycena rosella TaxID=1033263 RepID=A0AAD7GEP5_MYCRO|nr:hypothetical protein B0H17DRAFT_1205459 [Mycena rosella]